MSKLAIKINYILKIDFKYFYKIEETSELILYFSDGNSRQI